MIALVLGCDEAGDNGGLVLVAAGRADLPPFEGFVAEHPHPLAVGEEDGQVGVDWGGGVEGVVAF